MQEETQRHAGEIGYPGNGHIYVDAVFPRGPALSYGDLYTPPEILTTRKFRSLTSSDAIRCPSSIILKPFYLDRAICLRHTPRSPLRSRVEQALPRSTTHFPVIRHLR